MSDYSSKLRDPRWQEMRLRVMGRDGFACVCCGSKDNTLNVHHGYYERGFSPWEYDPDTLHTVCEKCHHVAQESIAAVHKAIASIGPKALVEACTWFDCDDAGREFVGGMVLAVAIALERERQKAFNEACPNSGGAK